MNKYWNIANEANEANEANSENRNHHHSILVSEK